MRRGDGDRARQRGSTAGNPGEAAELLASLHTLQEEARELAAALLPPRIVAGDTRAYTGVHRRSARPELVSVPCDPGERAG